MLRQILEDVAMTDWSTDSEGDRLTMLAAIDSLPVAQRENIGRFLLDNLATILNAPDDVVQFQSRTVVPNNGGPQLGFVVVSRVMSRDIVDRCLETSLHLILICGGGIQAARVDRRTSR